MFRIVSLLGCLLLLTIILGAPSALAVNKALSLDGSEDYVRIPDADSLNPSGDFTVSVWVKVNNLSDNMWILSKAEYYHFGYDLAIFSNKPWFSVHSSGTQWGNPSPDKISVDTWYHIAGVYFNNGERYITQIYVNGELKKEHNPDGLELATGNKNLLIGYGYTDQAQHFNGLIDEVRLWNVARTQEDIRKDMNQPIEDPELLEHLVGYWNFDSGTAEDLSQYDNDGALQGDATIVEVERAKVIFVPTPEYPTIQSGIDAANPGDTVIVDPGTYYENISISTNGIMLQGSGAGVTTIDGGGIGSVIKMSGISDVTISGFTITNGLGDGQDCTTGNDNGGGIAVYECSNITIRDNVITQNYASGDNADGGGILIAKCTAPINIMKNTITDNHPDNWGGGICIQGTIDVRIKRNDISNNDAGVGDGISLWSAGVGASASIINNRIANNQGVGIYISDDCSALIGGNRDSANDILGNIEYAVRNDSTNPINATYNYWGTTAEVEIQDAIWDYYDDPSRGVVDYNPWLGSTHEIVTAQALNLDGNGDWVRVEYSSSLDIEGQITLEAWIFLSNKSQEWVNVIERDYPGGWKLGLHWDHVVFTLYHVWDIFSDSVVPLNHWTHIAATYDQSHVRFYINGVLDKSVEATEIIESGTSPLIIGSRSGGSSFFPGLLDEIRTWNVARAQSEIQATMNTTLQGDEPGLVGYWNFDDGTANDSSLYGNHGTLMGDAEIIPLVGTWPPPKIGDVSGNGTVSAYDASLILQYVVGLIDEFPADRMGSPSAIEPRDYEVSLPNVEAPAGGKIQVPIAINDATGLLAGGITIKYDQTVLRVVDYASLKLLNGYYWKANTNLPGEVRFAFATTEVVTTYVPSPLKGEGQGEGGRLLMVEFEVLPNAEGMTSPLILENVNLSNSRSIKKIHGEVRVIPSNFALLQNFPNPFNPDTWLPYKLASDSVVSISIYNAKGQLIRTLHPGYQNAGIYVTKGKAAYWDGKDNAGEKVSSGVYFYNLQAGEFRSTRKMVIVK